MKHKFFTLLSLMLVAATAMWADHSVVTEGDVTTETWDFAEYTTAVDGAQQTSVTYEGLLCYFGTNSNKDAISKSGFKCNGTATASTRYIKWTPAYEGTVTVYYKSNNSSATDRIVAIGTQITTGTSLEVGKDGIVAFGNTNGSTEQSFNANISATTDYYIYNANGGCAITKIVYVYSSGGKTQLSGAWSDATYNIGDDASTNLPAFTVSGGSAVLGTDYTVAYSVVTDENSIVTLDAADGITAINTEAAATATVLATVTLLNEEDYTLAVADYDCEITVLQPACAAPVITFKGYNYTEGMYEFVATCETDGANLQYRLKGDAEYTSCTAGESFFVEATGDSNDKVIVKATKSGYTEAATTTSYYLNAAPAASSPETLIPFILGDDNTFKNHAYAYRSVTIGEESSASSVAGYVSGDANSMKLRTNQSSNTLTLYVHDGYTVTNVTINAKTNNTDEAKVVKVSALTVDDIEVADWTGKDVVFPINTADAVACSTGDISAASTIKFTFAAGGTGSMHTQIIASIVVTYTQEPTTAVEDIEVGSKTAKFIENGQVVILRNGMKYNAQGQVIK